MKAFNEFLRENLKGRSLRQVELLTGVSNSYLSMVLKGDRNPPTPEVLKKLSKVTSCSYDDLMQAAGYVTKPNVVKVPVLGSIPAGIPIAAIEEILDWEELSPELASKGEFFGLKVSGQSMAPKITEGDIVIVRKQDYCENNDIAVVMVNGYDATLKQVRKSEKGITLIGYNPAFEPVFYSNEEIENEPVKILGVVYEQRRPYKKY